jgi:tRNA nucleotidyltransferase/poly(A) polymerase
MNHNTIIEKLCEAGYPSYLVGGAVRDIFLGLDPHDFDITTKATPEEIAEVFQGYNVNVVGKSFGVSLINGIEVATFRKDFYPEGNGAKNCQVEYARTIEDDLSRRDLTINALALCVLSGEIIDEFCCLDDLKNSVIRFVGDGDLRIAEDPCRILRACRFLAKIEGTFSQDTFEALKRNAHLVSKIDAERVQKEIFTAMQCRYPSIFFNALYIIGALDLVFPGLSACIEFEGHGNHHIESVWDHLMLAGDSVNKRFPLIRLVAFLHDVGKPASFNSSTGTFLNHEGASAYLVEKWLRRLKFSTYDRETVVNLIWTHMLGSGPSPSPKAIRKFLKTLYDLNVNPSSWLRLRISDRKANLNKDPFTFSDIRYRRNVFNFKEVPVFNVNSLALKGGQLISIFNLTPGKIVGELQKYLLEFVIENGFDKNNEKDLSFEAKKYLDYMK